MKTVIVVESPAKARKIKTFFKDDTIVTSSFGHIYDLPKQEISIDIENNFQPNYQPLAEKKAVIKELRNFSKNYRVLLAADDDREGDAIAWHCGKVMNVNFNDKNRIIFHEISKKAIHKSIENVHQLNMNSVNAQQGRRIIDRLVGYSLSPLLWKHINTNKSGLSAGRVQSTLLLILKENEENIKNHQSKSSYEYKGDFKDKPSCELILQEPKEPKTILNLLIKDRKYRIRKQYHKEEKKYSASPFITSSLQQSAQNELGYSVKNTMNIAQKLYENGKITYMRTDSTNISQEFQGLLHNHISESYGENYFYRRSSNSKKVKGAQEAHECIRVTKLNESLNDKYTEYDRKLYELIKKRTICSHMKPAIYDNLIYELSNDTFKNGYFKGMYKVLLFDGYLKYSDPNLELKDKIEDLTDEIYNLTECLCSEVMTKPPQYPNESSIVKKLEKSGIGRPSTYASLIATLYNRNYTEIKTIAGDKISKKTLSLKKDDTIVEKVVNEKVTDQRNRIVLTDLGKQVLEYLMNHFSIIVNIEFTSLVESDLDRVAHGKIQWQEVVQKVYDSFKDSLEIQKSLTNTSFKNDNSRELGKYKKDKVILRDGKFGPYVSVGKRNVGLSHFMENNNVQYKDITLDLIRDYIPYPLKLGKYKKHDVMIHRGPYGKYMKYRGKNFRIPQKENYTLEECIRNI
tara:strand:- start:1385 stop:3442 length:2058 start_codon:yes stop_codon:yes gene_type:complete